MAQIIIDTKDQPTEVERTILSAWLGGAHEATEPAPAAKPSTRASRNKSKPTPEPTPEPTEEPTPEPTPEPEEDLLGEEEKVEEVATATIDDAIKAATAALSAGRATQVKKALGDLGAKKVADLKGAKIAQFISALDSED